MDISNIYDKFRLKKENLINYGFEKINDCYVIKKDILNNSMYAKFIINDDKITVDVYDYIDNEIYLPFNIVDAKGKFVSLIKDEVAIHLEDILKNCFIEEDLKEKLNKYIFEKYQTTAIYPWNDENHVYKLNGKWFCLVMNIKYKSLGILKDGKVDVINIKLDEHNIERIIDNKYFFKAYHMNKKYWITIMLSTKLDFNLITKYVDESYNIIKNSK